MKRRDLWILEDFTLAVLCIIKAIVWTVVCLSVDYTWMLVFSACYVALAVLFWRRVWIARARRP